MKKISLIVMSCIIACGLFANHGIVKGGEMSPKVEDTVSIDKKIADSQWLSNNSDTLEVDTAGVKLNLGIILGNSLNCFSPKS